MANYDVIIVGAGPAGMTAAIYAARADMKVLMLDKLSPGGQIINTNEIQNYTGAGYINGAELAIKMFEHTQKMNIEFDYKTVIEIIDNGENKLVRCAEDGTEYSTHSVILATGTRPRCLNIPSEKKYMGNGISWCAICDGAQYRDKDVVVIGGGNSAVEESIYLSGMVKSLTIVTMFDLTADPIACDKLRSMKHVIIYPYQDVIEFLGDTKLESIHFKSTKTGEEHTVSCDGVFEYIGLTPTTDGFKSLGVLNDYGYVEVNSHMETKIPGVFGAGDCITKFLRQVVTACSDGAVAAQQAAQYVKKIMG
jgi:thioredoxin reductase (NADPH)